MALSGLGDSNSHSHSSNDHDALNAIQLHANEMAGRETQTVRRFSPAARQPSSVRPQHRPSQDLSHRASFTAGTGSGTGTGAGAGATTEIHSAQSRYGSLYTTDSAGHSAQTGQRPQAPSRGMADDTVPTPWRPPAQQTMTPYPAAAHTTQHLTERQPSPHRQQDNMQSAAGPRHTGTSMDLQAAPQSVYASPRQRHGASQFQSESIASPAGPVELRGGHGWLRAANTMSALGRSATAGHEVNLTERQAVPYSSLSLSLDDSRGTGVANSVHSGFKGRQGGREQGFHDANVSGYGNVAGTSDVHGTDRQPSDNGNGSLDLRSDIDLHASQASQRFVAPVDGEIRRGEDLIGRVAEKERLNSHQHQQEARYQQPYATQQQKQQQQYHQQRTHPHPQPQQSSMVPSPTQAQAQVLEPAPIPAPAQHTWTTAGDGQRGTAMPSRPHVRPLDASQEVNKHSNQERQAWYSSRGPATKPSDSHTSDADRIDDSRWGLRHLSFASATASSGAGGGDHSITGDISGGPGMSAVSASAQQGTPWMHESTASTTSMRRNTLATTTMTTPATSDVAASTPAHRLLNDTSAPPPLSRQHRSPRPVNTGPGHHVQPSATLQSNASPRLSPRHRPTQHHLNPSTTLAAPSPSAGEAALFRFKLHASAILHEQASERQKAPHSSAPFPREPPVQSYQEQHSVGGSTHATQSSYATLMSRPSACSETSTSTGSGPFMGTGTSSRATASYSYASMPPPVAQPDQRITAYHTTGSAQASSTQQERASKASRTNSNVLSSLEPDPVNRAEPVSATSPRRQRHQPAHVDQAATAAYTATISAATTVQSSNTSADLSRVEPTSAAIQIPGASSQRPPPSPGVAIGSRWGEAAEAMARTSRTAAHDPAPISPGVDSANPARPYGGVVDRQDTLDMDRYNPSGRSKELTLSVADRSLRHSSRRSEQRFRGDQSLNSQFSVRTADLMSDGGYGEESDDEGEGLDQDTEYLFEGVETPQGDKSDGVETPQGDKSGGSMPISPPSDRQPQPVHEVSVVMDHLPEHDATPGLGRDGQGGAAQLDPDEARQLLRQHLQGSDSEGWESRSDFAASQDDGSVPTMESAEDEFETVLRRAQHLTRMGFDALTHSLSPQAQPREVLAAPDTISRDDVELSRDIDAYFLSASAAQTKMAAGTASTPKLSVGKRIDMAADKWADT